MAKKRITGFLIILFCLFLLLCTLFFGGYLFYDHQIKENEMKIIKTVDYPLETKKLVEIKVSEQETKKENLLPDLYVEGFYPKKLNDGDGYVIMEVTLQNNEDVDAYNVEWKIIGSDSYSMDVETDQFEFNPLYSDLINQPINLPIDVSYENPINVVKQDTTYEINYKFHPADCPVTVAFVVDPENKIKEKDETNNIQSVEIKGCDEEYTSEKSVDQMMKEMKKVVIIKPND